MYRKHFIWSKIVRCEWHGIKYVTLDWFCNDIKCRKQCVKLNVANPSCLNVLMGLEQGSLFGPIFFYRSSRTYSSVYLVVILLPFHWWLCFIRGGGGWWRFTRKKNSFWQFTWKINKSHISRGIKCFHVSYFKKQLAYITFIAFYGTYMYMNMNYSLHVHNLFIWCYTLFHQ